MSDTPLTREDLVDEYANTARRHLSTHAENVAYYGNFPTQFLERFLPTGRADVLETSLRLAAVEEVLKGRTESEPYTVKDSDDLDVSSRILDVLRTTDLPEGAWDGAVEHILEGTGWE